MWPSDWWGLERRVGSAGVAIEISNWIHFEACRGHFGGFCVVRFTPALAGTASTSPSQDLASDRDDLLVSRLVPNGDELKIYFGRRR
jgi:hypothetical protein